MERHGVWQTVTERMAEDEGARLAMVHAMVRRYSEENHLGPASNITVESFAPAMLDGYRVPVTMPDGTEVDIGPVIGLIVSFEAEAL